MAPSPRWPSSSASAPASSRRCSGRWRSTADLSSLPHGGGKPASLTAQQRVRLRRKVRERDDISLAELQDYLREEEQVEVHVSTICRALRQADLPRKKSP